MNLTLLAQTPEDLPALAALLQDATLRAPDIAFDARGHRLVLLVNRYRWEAAAPSRSRAAMRIETTTRVQQQHWPQGADAVLNLLTIEWAEPHLTLSFSDGITLRAHCEALDLILEDLGDPWTTTRLPKHQL
ncbi:hypothetical protein FHS79_001463 [Polymorphobacter multimanifer]|uniref:DUF2948 family protein n=1 Tax=Polymorphobacter multimanifer TaxID=1070431 RepID=A0A841L3R0_9SPHN|nr:DUF2948 family protein [Polymorphobacter multimanifer]MBB6227297.1 hypothetical protein [Polymorphobacter multimanifer]